LRAACARRAITGKAGAAAALSSGSALSAPTVPPWHFDDDERGALRCEVYFLSRHCDFLPAA